MISAIEACGRLILGYISRYIYLDNMERLCVKKEKAKESKLSLPEQHMLGCGYSTVGRLLVYSTKPRLCLILCRA